MYLETFNYSVKEKIENILFSHVKCSFMQICIFVHDLIYLRSDGNTSKMNDKQNGNDTALFIITCSKPLLRKVV